MPNSSWTGDDGNNIFIVPSNDTTNWTINALGGNDQITSGAGNDIIDGGSGNDVISPGAGQDVMTGGTGADVFTDTSADLNGDTITDYFPGDRIQITDLAPTTADFNSIQITGPHTLSFGTTYSITIDNIGPGRFVSRAIGNTGIEIRLQQDAHNDFSGDGRSDILWRSDSGQFSDWLAHSNGDGGFGGNDANAFAGVPTSWHVAGTGDFNGDGREDVLWRSDSGQLSDWLAHSNGDGGFTNNDANAFVGVPTAWTVAGIGDFNGDGRSDILWRNTSSGQLSNWLGTASGGFTANDANALIGVPTTWTVAGTGDFNGDGISDLLWRGPNGEVSDWLGTSAGGWSINDANALKVVPSNWHIVAVGDFNGDAISDMLWRSDGGQISDWLGQSNGGFVMNDANALIGVPTSWHVAGTGDYNGDGIDDLLWRSTSGQLSDWLGQSTGGFTSNDAHAFVTVPTSWHVQDPFVHDPFGTV